MPQSNAKDFKRDIGKYFSTLRYYFSVSMMKALKYNWYKFKKFHLLRRKDFLCN
jgi:hypothetical protein